MKSLLSENLSDRQFSLENTCDECDVSFKEVNQLQTHKKDSHVDSNGRVFSYKLNEKKAKAKLLKGAKRKKPLDVEIKSGCVNMRFNDGSYYGVALPILRQWYRNFGKPLNPI